jgi:threonine/homoserine/homoserine lactone efflux protein
MQILYSLLLGFMLSFLGQLPLGIISLTATQIAVQENFRNAWKYAAGVALIEMIYLRFILSAVQWITGGVLVFTIFNLFTTGLLLVLGILSIISARKQNESKKAFLLNNKMDRFVLGVTVSALNPAQIPFWIIWTGYFINLKWLSPGFNYFNLFTIGSGIGTVCGLVLYMFGGNWLVNKMKAENRTLNKIIGCIFLIAAIIQIYRISVH